MSETSRSRRSNVTHRKTVKQVVRRNRKFGTIRVIVILLSLVSLISRIIYCSYATWLTFTTFDCLPCVANQTSKLFVSQHSLLKLNTVRGLDTKLMANKTDARIRVKRYDHQNDKSLIDDYYETRHRAEQMTKQPFDKMTIYWSVTEDQPIELKTDPSLKLDDNNSIASSNDLPLTPVVSENIDEITAETERNTFALNVSQQTFSSRFGEDEHTILQNAIDMQNNENLNEDNQTIHTSTSGKETAVFEEQTTAYYAMNDSSDSQILIENAIINEINDTIDAYIENSTGIQSLNNIRVDKLYGLSNETRNQTNLVIRENSPKIFIGLFIQNDVSDKSFNKTFKEKQLNGNNGTNARIDKSLKHLKSNDDYLLSNLTKQTIDVCSEDCGQFLNIKLNDPKDRKWAMVFITCFLYLYALVMLTIFLGSCLSSVDLLIIATFIEGAKLFAGFVMLIVDNINGKKTKFSLIEVKINVDQRGNGWTADFYYSEYLLDLIIFVLAAILSVKSFRIFSKRTEKVGSIEASTNSYGSYRARHSSNTSRMLHSY